MRALLALLLAAVMAPWAAAASPSADVEVLGTGRPVLMLHGLASHRDTWKETCAALQRELACHLVQLPGFAGAPAQPAKHYLEAQQASVLAYLNAKGIQEIDVVGHSLGGNLALMLAAAEPQRVRRVVVVDSVPFIAALGNPNATPEQARQMAADMQTRMKGQPMSPAQRQGMARGMTRSSDGQQAIVRWGTDSDADTVTQAMGELWGGDFRPLLPRVAQPVLVLGSWAAYARMGATLESTQAVFERQYAELKDKRIAMSAKGFHFLMWDDADWLVAQIKDFLVAR